MSVPPSKKKKAKEEEDLSTALWCSVQRICREIGVGGRVVLQGKVSLQQQQHDDDREGGEEELAVVRVIDCAMWTAQATARLRAEHPTALISVESSAMSLSGFIVVVSERAPRAAYRRRLRLRVLLAMLLLGAVAAAGTLALGAAAAQQEEEAYCDGPGLGGWFFFFGSQAASAS